MEDWEVRLCLRDEERGDPVMIKSGQEACCLKGEEEGRAPPSVWEKYWNKETLLDQTGHSQSRAGGKAKGTKGWSQEEREKEPRVWRPWIHRARKHLTRWPLDNMRHSVTCWCAPALHTRTNFRGSIQPPIAQ